MPTRVIAHANNVHGKLHEHEDGKWSFTVWAGDDYTRGYKFAIPNPMVGMNLFMLLKPLEASKEYYAPDERRPLQPAAYGEGYPGKAWTEGDSLEAPANPRSDPRIYSPGGDTWANKFKTEVAAHQDTLRALEVKEEHRKANEEAMMRAQIERDEKDIQLREALAKIDGQTRAIQALIPYREFFDVIKTLTKNA